jgi:23S rRNA (uracil1939-C5)-methyltransferase
VRAALGPLPGQRVLELHAGTGNLTRLLDEAAEVVAVDSRRVPWPTPVVAGVAHEVARALATEGRAFDIALLDPPRTGASELMEPLLALAPGRIVYVSCDPATLARDIEALARGGYRPERAQPLDLMPQTAHVEVVVTLVRAA